MQGVRHLDEHIWAEILKRLPAKVIGRIRCVCKSWNSLISSSFFINHHLSLVNFRASSSENNKPGYHLLFDPDLCWSPEVDYCFYNPDEEEPHLARFSPLPFSKPPQGEDRYKDGVVYKLIGVINGVVCLSREQSWSRPTGSAILWNPTIGKYAATPGDRCEGGDWVAVGFGFDARTDAFKVVRFTRPDYGDEDDDSRCRPLEDEAPPRFEVLSSRGGGWRSVAAEHLGPLALMTSHCCYKNGAIHWVVARPGGLHELLVFDCERDEFRIMRLPRQVRRRHIGELFIRYYNSNTGGGVGGGGTGTLSLLAGTGLWVMDESSGKWKKVKPPLPDYFLRICEKGSILYRLEKDFGKGWVRLDPRRVQLAGLYQFINGYAFQPTLFLMDKINGQTLKV